MHDVHDFAPLLVVTTVALLTVLILLKIRVMRIPIVVGEILMGILIGKSGLGLIPAEPGPWLHFLSLFGFTMLMFLSGLEIDFAAVTRNLRRSRDEARGNTLVLAALTFGLCLLLSFGMAMLLVQLGMVQVTGTEIILGAFLAGAVVSLLTQPGGGRLGHKLDAIGYGFLIPYFFIMIGAQFEFGQLGASGATMLLVPMLVVMAFLVKLAPAMVLRRRFGGRAAVAGGFLLSSRLSLIIAAAAIGLEMEAITPAVNSALILVAVITCLASPLIYDRIMEAGTCPIERPADLEPLIGHLVDNPEGLHLKLAQVPVAGKPSLADHTLLQTRLRSRTGVTVIALRREDGILVENPPADTELRAGDFLVVIGEDAQIRALEELDRDAAPPDALRTEC